MYNILFSEKANFQINEFINSYKNSFLSRFIDTWIYNEELIITSYIKISEELKVKIYSEIKNKLVDKTILWRVLLNKEYYSIFLNIWNYLILLNYKENKIDKNRIIEEISFYKK
jgi:hypothetical protein